MIVDGILAPQMREEAMYLEELFEEQSAMDTSWGSVKYSFYKLVSVLSEPESSWPILS